MNSKAEPLPPRVVDDIFRHLKNMFPDFIRTHGESDEYEWRSDREGGQTKRVKVDKGRPWAHGLAGYSREEIKRGINACLNGNREKFLVHKAPSLPEFKQLCRPPRNATRLGNEKSPEFYRDLHRKRTPQETANGNAALAELKRLARRTEVAA